MHHMLGMVLGLGVGLYSQQVPSMDKGAPVPTSSTCEKRSWLYLCTNLHWAYFTLLTHQRFLDPGNNTILTPPDDVFSGVTYSSCVKALNYCPTGGKSWEQSHVKMQPLLSPVLKDVVCFPFPCTYFCIQAVFLPICRQELCFRE